MKMCRRESRCKKKRYNYLLFSHFFCRSRKYFYLCARFIDNIMSYLIKVLNNFIINGKLKERSSY